MDSHGDGVRAKRAEWARPDAPALAAGQNRVHSRRLYPAFDGRRRTTRASTTNPASRERSVSTAPPINPPPPGPSDAALRSVDVAISPPEIIRVLDARALKGKLPGFTTRSDGPLFSTAAFASPFDHELLAYGAAEAGKTRLTFRLRMLPKLPAIMAVVLVVTLWPGVWVTHSMLATYFDWYRINIWWTCAWYVPMTIGPLPWMWTKWVKGSRRQAEDHAREVIDDIVSWTGAAAASHQSARPPA